MPGVSLRGDYAKLRGLIATFRDFVGSGPLTQLSEALAETALAEVRREFRSQSDPYGVDWAPLKKRKGRILRDTGRLANSFTRVRLGKRGFTIGSNVEYADVHQRGRSYTHTPGSNTHNARGRFVSSSKMLTKKTKRLRKGFRQISHGAYKVVIPRRMMLPIESRGLGMAWETAFTRTTKRVMSRLLRRR